MYAERGRASSSLWHAVVFPTPFGPHTKINLFMPALVYCYGFLRLTRQRTYGAATLHLADVRDDVGLPRGRIRCVPALVPQDRGRVGPVALGNLQGLAELGRPWRAKG